MESKEVAKELLEDAFAGGFKAALKNGMARQASSTSAKNLTQFTFNEAAEAGAKLGFEEFAGAQNNLLYADLTRVAAKKFFD